MQPPPPSVVKTWPKPNFINPVTRGNGNIILNIVLFGVLLIFLALRIFTRTYLRNNFGADDTFILLALLPATAFFVISVLADAEFLWIRHVYDIPVKDVISGLKMVLATEVVFAAACTFTKLSMLMLVRRMLSSASLFWRRITWLAITIVGIQGSVFCLTVVFQCRPPQNYWKITHSKDPNCIDQTWSLLAAGIINAVTDLITILLPIRTVWTLQLPARQLFIVVLLFSLGFMSCFAGAIRTYYMYIVTKSYDQTWDSYPVWITSAIELYIGMISASIPACKPFFATYLPHIFGSMASVPSCDLTTSHQTTSRTQRSQHNAALSVHDREVEMLTFHDTVEMEKPGKALTKSIGSNADSRGESDDEEWIQGTQAVEIKEEESRYDMGYPGIAY